MMPPNGNQPNPEEQLQQLQNDLQDAHLVIGQQQVTLLRQSMLLNQMNTRLAELAPQQEEPVGPPGGIPLPTPVD